MTKANWIDVSYFQDPSKFDYQAAKQAGIQGLIIRAGYGKTQDTAAAQHIANAQKYGFMWHLYHYWYNMGGEAEWAVQNAKSLGLTANQYLFLDMEDKSLPVDWNGQFAVFRKAVGDTYKVGLYCSDSPYKAKFQDSQLQQLKVARLVASYSYEPVNYDIWQMSGAGSGGFGSYTDDVDRDYTKSDILSLYATTNINPVVTKPTADLQYIQPIMLQPGYDTETNIYGLGYSPDNGVHFYVTYTTFGAKYRQEDADRLWKYLQGFVTKQISSAVSLTWDNIKGKPDVALKTDIPSLTDYAKKSDLPKLDDYAKKTDIPQAPDLTGYAKLSDIPSVTGLVKEAELADYAKLADVPKSMSWNQITDKPILALKSDIPNVSGFLKQADLADYAKKTDIPKTPDLSVYAKKSDIPSLDGYTKMSDLPSVTGLVKQTDLVGYAKLSDIPKPPDLTPYAKTSEVDEVKATADSALSNAEKAQSTADANTKALANKVDKSEIPVVPTDLVHTAEMEQVKETANQAAQTASEAVTLAKSASVTIDTSNIHQIKKPSEYSEGFSYEVKALSDLGIDLTEYDTSVQSGWIGLVKSVQVSMFSTVYVTQTVRVLGSYRPTTFIRNGSGDSWYPFELVTTW